MSAPKTPSSSKQLRAAPPAAPSSDRSDSQGEQMSAPKTPSSSTPASGSEVDDVTIVRRLLSHRLLSHRWALGQIVLSHRLRLAEATLSSQGRASKRCRRLQGRASKRCHYFGPRARFEAMSETPSSSKQLHQSVDYEKQQRSPSRCSDTEAPPTPLVALLLVQHRVAPLVALLVAPLVAPLVVALPPPRQCCRCCRGRRRQLRRGEL